MLSRLHNTPVAGELNDNEHLDWQGERMDINMTKFETSVVDNGVHLDEHGMDIENEHERNETQTQKPLDYHDYLDYHGPSGAGFTFWRRQNVLFY